MMKSPQFAVRLAPIWVLSGLLMVLLTAGPVALGQALPAAEAAPISTGFALPTTLGTLQYAVSASQALTWGYYSSTGVYASTNLDGDLAYLSNSKLHPFSLVLAGGRSWSESSQQSFNFVDLGVSQVASLGRWNFVISDNLSYLPGTAVSGLSGVPGVGDLGVNPVQVGTDTGQGILTNFSNRINNVVAGSLSRALTGKTSINASGSYSVMRFLSSSNNFGTASSEGLDNDAVSGGAGISHQIDGRNIYGGNYSYSSFDYSSGNTFGVATPSFTSQTASGLYTHQFSRKLSMSAAAGPQWIHSSVYGDVTSLSLFVAASANYTGKSFVSSLAFTRAANAGFGVTGGVVSDSVTASISRKFAVVWAFSATSGFTRSSTISALSPVSYSVDTYAGGVQLSRALARSLSCFASYTAEDQSNSQIQAVDFFSGLSQTAAFGITYSPSSLHLGRQ